MMYPPFNMSKRFVVDDLHGVYLGAVKQLLTYWFGVKYKSFVLRLLSNKCWATYIIIKQINATYTVHFYT